MKKRKSVKKVAKKTNRKPFKKVVPYNINHPDFAGRIEFAFEDQGINYYRASKDFLLPTGRYKFVLEKLNEVDIRMSLETLKGYIKIMKNSLQVIDGQIKLDKLYVTLAAMESRTQLAFEADTVKRLATVVYFDDTEDLRDYDKDYAEEKIKRWDKSGTLSFFLTRPIVELLGLSNISEEYLKNYLMDQKEAQVLIDALTLDIGTSSNQSS